MGKSDFFSSAKISYSNENKEYASFVILDLLEMYSFLCDIANPFIRFFNLLKVILKYVRETG